MSKRLSPKELTAAQQKCKAKKMVFDAASKMCIFAKDRDKKLEEARKRREKVMQERKPDPVITMGGQKISSFSGPISFAVLKPTEWFIQQQKDNRLNAPVLIFLGDEHTQLKGTCHNCTCKLDQKSCCMNVNSKEWFDILARISNGVFPVDVYAETATILVTDTAHKEKFVANSSTTNEMIRDLIVTQRSCFAREKDCDARYHLTDPRSTIDFSTRLPLDKAVMPKYYYESLINTVMIGWSGIEMDYILKYAYNSKEFLACLKWVTEALYNWSSGDIGTAAKRWTHMFFSSPYFENGSLIMKQIKKCKGPMAEKANWQTLCEGLARVYFSQVQLLTVDIMQGINQRAVYISELLNGRTPQITPFITGYKIWPLQMLDLYILGRSWKEPKDQNFNPGLVVVYQGAMHSRGMAQVLSEGNLYEVVTTIPANLVVKEGDPRCMKISKSVDIDKMLDEIDANAEMRFVEERKYYEGHVPTAEDVEDEDFIKEPPSTGFFDFMQHLINQPSFLKTKSRRRI